MWKQYNPNPKGKNVGDCVVRAISKALDLSWHDTYIELCLQGYILGDMPSSNVVWSMLLKSHNFIRHTVDECSECYTVEAFCRSHPKGSYVIGTGTHALAVIDGSYYDAWDSGKEIPQYYFEKEV